MPEWFARGYCGAGNVGGLIGSLRGRPAVVAGSAKGVFDEVRAAEARLGSQCVVFACNDVSVLLPRVHHMVSLHTPKLLHWVALRRDVTSSGYGNRDFEVHDGGLYGDAPWHQWKGLTPTMSQSGMFSAQIAYLMDCDPIVLCGVPIDGTPRFWEHEGVGENYFSGMRRQVIEETSYKPEFKAALRSMSGWTKGFFGAF